MIYFRKVTIRKVTSIVYGCLIFKPHFPARRGTFVVKLYIADRNRLPHTVSDGGDNTLFALAHLPSRVIYKGEG